MSAADGSGSTLLIVAETLPVGPVGTSIVLRRLLENFRAEEVMLMGRNPPPRYRPESRSLRYPYVTIPALPAGIRGERYWRLGSAVTGVPVGLAAIRRHRPAALLAVFPYEHALLTGYWLHRLTGLPLVAYLCDLYAEDRDHGWEGYLARWLQPRVFRAAARVLAANQGMVDYYRARYGMDVVALPACINAPIPEPAPLPSPGERFVVGYSGNVNTTRLDSLRALLKAIGGDPAFEIRYLTPQTPELLRAYGVWAENATASFVADEEELVRRLAACDALFLPLAFEPKDNSRDQLATCFGIKSYEYFLSQRPILLHCPEDYFIARYFRERGCGMVVSDAGSAALRSALEKLRSEAPLRADYALHGLRAAHEFEGPKIASVLRGVLREVSARGKAAP